MEPRVQEPRQIWWARPRKLCGLERPGGGGRSHRTERREAEIAYLVARGVRMCVSTMPTRHNLAAYEAAELEWHHVPVAKTEDGAAALEELLPFLRRRMRSSGAVAVHGNRSTDFVAAVCAAHVHEARGLDPAQALAEAARAGLLVSDAACALLGVAPQEVQERLELAAASARRGGGRRAA
ncbi:MAG TPA: hypothetical protein VEY90_11000 [Thermoleophilaceae bacterium]|nr:hypothetical protein [Thermoleophilaceae bacterium]